MLLNQFKRAMRTLTPEQMAAAELEEARLSLLEAHSGFEFASAMVTYHQQRVERLQEYLEQVKRDADAADGFMKGQA